MAELATVEADRAGCAGVLGALVAAGSIGLRPAPPSPSSKAVEAAAASGSSQLQLEGPRCTPASSDSARDMDVHSAHVLNSNFSRIQDFRKL